MFISDFISSFLLFYHQLMFSVCIHPFTIPETGNSNIDKDNSLSISIWEIGGEYDFMDVVKASTSSKGTQQRRTYPGYL